jgi:recombination protein RecA
LDLRKIATISNSEGVIGTRVRAKVVKNKVAPPFKEAVFEILYDEGVSKSGALIDAAVETGLVKKSGSWFSYKDRNLAQGKEQLRTLLKKEDSLRRELEEELRKIIYSQAGTEEDK